jgi:cell division protein FtsX
MIWWREALGLLGRSRSRTLLLALCWTLALALAGALGWLWRNSSAVRESWTRRVPAECYLESADPALQERVRELLATTSSLRWAGLVPAEQAADEFREGFGLDVPALLGENPFPPTVRLEVRPDAPLEEVDRDLARLAHAPGVSGVFVERELLGQVGDTLRRAGRAALAVLVLLSGLTLLLLVSALRSLQRSWAGEAALLAVQGARPWQLALPVWLALAMPAAVAWGLSWGALSVIAGLLQQVGWKVDSVEHSWPLWVGTAVPLACATLLIQHNARGYNR